jgi:membrane-anchored glycerophosphoryl diester phosphodiesterase (GDPDase)
VVRLRLFRGAFEFIPMLVVCIQSFEMMLFLIVEESTVIDVIGDCEISLNRWVTLISELIVVSLYLLARLLEFAHAVEPLCVA